MFLPAPTEGGDFTPVPAGTHLAVCYRVIDLGTHKSTFSGEEKFAHKILLSWELPQERADDGKPLVISKRYTWSMHEKATLRKHLEAWRGAAFQQSDFGPTGFDIKNILGKACILTVVENAKADGKVFANVDGVGKLMKGMEMPKGENPTTYLWIAPERWSEGTFSSLSDNLRELIKASPEYAAMQRGGNGQKMAPEWAEDGAYEDVPF